MGMFDVYKPVPEIPCPRCGKILDWQGKSGPCLLAVWTQGVRYCTTGNTNKEEVLPDNFELYAGCSSDGCGVWVDAEGDCENGVWTKTTVTRVDTSECYNDSALHAWIEEVNKKLENLCPPESKSDDKN